MYYQHQKNIWSSFMGFEIFVIKRCIGRWPLVGSVIAMWESNGSYPSKIRLCQVARKVNREYNCNIDIRLISLLLSISFSLRNATITCCKVLISWWTSSSATSAAWLHIIAGFINHYRNYYETINVGVIKFSRVLGTLIFQSNSKHAIISDWFLIYGQHGHFSLFNTRA